jgi:hypothetical protein
LIAIAGGTATATRQVIGPEKLSDPSKLAENLGSYPVDNDGDIEQLQFDIGQTFQILDFVKAGILEENPEAS